MALSNDKPEIVAKPGSSLGLQYAWRCNTTFLTVSSTNQPIAQIFVHKASELKHGRCDGLASSGLDVFLGFLKGTKARQGSAAIVLTLQFQAPLHIQTIVHKKANTNIMDFFAHLEGLCPVHFPVNANDMTFFGNEGDQMPWDGHDLEQVPDQTICLCSEYPGDDDVDLVNAGELVLAGPSAGNNMDIAGQSLSSSAATPGVTSNNHNSPGSREASGSASADPAASQTPNSKLFTCAHCGSISAKTPRDFKRHLATAKHRRNASRNGREEIQVESSPNRGTGFRCPVSSCDKTFPRKDNLWRHIAKMHGISDGDE